MSSTVERAPLMDRDMEGHGRTYRREHRLVAAARLRGWSRDRQQQLGREVRQRPERIPFVIRRAWGSPRLPQAQFDKALLMNLPSTIPPIALKAWPSLVGAKFVERLTSPVPVDPDTIFDVYKTKTGKLLTLIRSDYPDPYDEERELHEISHTYRAGDLIKPYDEATTIAIQEHDEMEGDFFVVDESVTYFKVYYYIAQTTQYREDRLASIELLVVADSLVNTGNLEGLEALHSALAQIIHLDMTNEDIELLPSINRYVGEAINLLNTGKSPVDANTSLNRKFLADRTGVTARDITKL